MIRVAERAEHHVNEPRLFVARLPVGLLVRQRVGEVGLVEDVGDDLGVEDLAGAESDQGEDRGDTRGDPGD